jgi:hypothetical protein
LLDVGNHFIGFRRRGPCQMQSSPRESALQTRSIQ